MRAYTYKCDECGSLRRRLHRMADTEYYGRITLCLCGHPMRRVMQPVRINWNGLPPSKGEMGPAAKALLDPREQARLTEEYAGMKAARGEEWKP